MYNDVILGLRVELQEDFTRGHPTPNTRRVESGVGYYVILGLRVPRVDYIILGLRVELYHSFHAAWLGAWMSRGVRVRRVESVAVYISMTTSNNPYTA